MYRKEWKYFENIEELLSRKYALAAATPLNGSKEGYIYEEGPGSPVPV